LLAGAGRTYFKEYYCTQLQVPVCCDSFTDWRKISAYRSYGQIYIYVQVRSRSCQRTYRSGVIWVEGENGGTHVTLTLTLLYRGRTHVRVRVGYVVTGYLLHYAYLYMPKDVWCMQCLRLAQTYCQLCNLWAAITLLVHTPYSFLIVN
jgi:hypothetical protein